MKYRMFAFLILLFHANMVLAQQVTPDQPLIPQIPDLSTLYNHNQNNQNTLPTKNAADVPKIDPNKTAAVQKKPPANTPSITNLQKLATISTQQSGNTNFDIKTVNLNKGIKVTSATSIVQLSNAKITSFTRTEENVSNLSEAMYVISSDEIKRMGVQKLADILRFAPGVAVAQAGANTWYIAVRGFNGADSNKLLVLIDGRSIYSTLYGGVLWQEQDYLLDDIERIEIVRGPGGVLWGSNAVNGVINIITKNSKDTQGDLLSAGGGHIIQMGEGRIGKKIGDNTYGRIYIKGTHLRTSPGIPDNDAGKMLQTGFRMDSLANAIGDITFSGDVYKGSIGPDLLNGLQNLINAEEYTGNNLLLNWSYTNPCINQNHQILTYLDHTWLNAAGALIDNRNTYYLGYQFSQKLGMQQIIAGINYKRVSDNIPTIAPLQFIPKSKIDPSYAGYIQDDVSFLNKKAHFIIGTKYENNNYTGSEWQPSVRGSYKFQHGSLVWVAWSRAVRIPTRLEEDLNAPPFLVGNTHLLAETASVYEAGWRKQWKKVSFDITAYNSNYQNLVTTEGNTEGNKMSGSVSGLELSPSFQLLPKWLVRFNYSFASSDLHVSKTSTDTELPFLTENSYPGNMAEIVSMWDINACWQFNAYLRYMDQIKVQNTDLTIQNIPRYTVIDASLVWKQNKLLNWQLVARNLGKKHYEWGGIDVPKIMPSIALYLTVNFP